MISTRQLLLLLCMMQTIVLHSMNAVRPYQILLRPPKQHNSWMQFYTSGQFGYKSRAFGEHGEVNPLQLYQMNQNGLAMLDGFDSATPIGQKRVRIDASDDGIRGHFTPCADFNVEAAMQFGLRFFMPHYLSLAFYLPYYHMSLRDVFWRNCTQNISVQDARVNAYLANNLAENICAWGNLDIGGWKRSGIGDVTASLEWIHAYPQKKPMLKNVTINGRLGATFPTCLRADEDKLMAFAFGNDGAYGIISAIGLDLYIGEYIKAGLDVQLMYQFGNTRCRRIKTDAMQGDLFLLAKTEAYKDFGLTQQFSFYWEFYNICRGTSAKLAYQFYKHGEDTLSLNSNEFSTSVANSAESLRSYTTHDLFVILNYDFASHLCEESLCVPYLSAFIDIPFNGKRAIVTSNAGFIIGVNF